MIGAGALIARLGRSDVGTDAMKTVRAYLSAIRARDVERALEIARPRERPVGQEATFLAAEVLRSDWKIEKLTASDVEESDIEGLPRRQARVAATLTGPGGARLVTPSGSSSHDGSFELIDDGDGWRISDPFAHLTFKSSALWYFDLNGHQIPDDPTQTETAASPSSYALFPGLYTVRGTSPEVVATPPQQLLALPGSYSTVARPDVTMTAKGVEEYQRGVNTILDGCVADQQKASINDRGCTLRIAGRLRYGGHDYPGFDVWPIQWTVVSRPVVKPTVQATFLDTDITEPGVIQIKATARDGGQRIEVSRTCLLGSLPFYGGLPPNGTVTVRWKEKAGATAPARLHELYAQCDQPE